MENSFAQAPKERKTLISPLQKMGAFQLAGQIKEGHISSEQVVRTHIDYIQKVNPLLNAVVENRFTEALKEAQEKDRNPDFSKPLWGVPCTIKEMIAVQGMKHTLGSTHRKTQTMKEDASVVTRLKNAGAIILGTTNVPEVGFWFECSNKVYGQTNNPYDLSRTCGGSSGGEGAIIGAGGSPFGLGSDIGGSIRMPAAFCGIFGHKPSLRMIPMTGHTPIYSYNYKDWTGSRYPLTVLGPMSRKASDLYDLMKLLLGPDYLDQGTREDVRLQDKVKDWSQITVYKIPDPIIHGCSETESVLIESVNNAASYFKQLGARVEELPANLFVHATEFWFARLGQIEGRSFETMLNPVGKIDYVKEFSKLLLNKSDYTIPSLICGLMEKAAVKNPHVQHKKNKSYLQLQELKKQLALKLGSNSILLMPAHPRLAPTHHSVLLRPFDFSFTSIINALEFPATAAPVGLSAGLPLALQIVAGPDQDHLSLSAAEALELAFGGWQPPTGLY